MGLGIGAIVRHSSAAVGVLVGVVYVLGQVIRGVFTAAMGYVPISLMANLMSTTKRLAHAPDGQRHPEVGVLVFSSLTACERSVAIDTLNSVPSAPPASAPPALSFRPRSPSSASS